MTSIELSLLTSIIPGILGLIVAYAVLTSRGRALRRIVSTASGVFANFGGVPLAFLFIATLGTTGLVTDWLKALGFDPWSHGFDLYTFARGGHRLHLLPAPAHGAGHHAGARGAAPGLAGGGIGAGRPRAGSTGATSAGPVLFPSFLGGVLLLFGSALSAYATAEALTSGSIPLTPIQIGSFLNGNVIAGPAERRQGARPGPGRDHRRGDGVLRHPAKKGIALVALVESTPSSTPRTDWPGPPRPWSAGRLRNIAWWRGIVLVLTGAFFLVPLFAALRFSLENFTGGFTLSALHGHTEPARVHRRAEPLGSPGRGDHRHHPRPDGAHLGLRPSAAAPPPPALRQHHHRPHRHPPSSSSSGCSRWRPTFLKSTPYLLALEYTVLGHALRLPLPRCGPAGHRPQTLVEASRSLGGGWRPPCGGSSCPTCAPACSRPPC